MDTDALVGDTGAGGCEAGHTPGTHKKSICEPIGIPIGKGSEPGGLSTCLEVMGPGGPHPAKYTSDEKGTETKGKIAVTLGPGNAVRGVVIKVI